MTVRSILLLAAAFLLHALPAAAIDLSEGKWEITMKMDMPGLPFQLPPVKVTNCITKENAVPQPEEKGKECTIKDSQVKGNVVTWVADCKDKNGTLHSEGEVTYHGKSFDGTIVSTTKSSDGEMQMTQKLSGRFLGPCH